MMTCLMNVLRISCSNSKGTAYFLCDKGNGNLENENLPLRRKG